MRGKDLAQTAKSLLSKCSFLVSAYLPLVAPCHSCLPLFSHFVSCLSLCFPQGLPISKAVSKQIEAMFVYDSDFLNRYSNAQAGSTARLSDVESSRSNARRRRNASLCCSFSKIEICNLHMFCHAQTSRFHASD